MKILQLLCFPLYGSGSGTYVRKLSATLKKQGHQVAIACPDSRQLPGIKIYEVKLPFMAVFTGHPEYKKAKLYSQLSGYQLNKIQSAFMSSIIKAVEDFQPEVIHVHHASNLSWIANYIKAVFQIHYVVTSHNTDVINAVLDKRYIPLTQDALRRADIITAVSKNTRERLLEILGKGIRNLARKTKVVTCGVDVRNFPNKGSVTDINKRFHLNGKKVILYSGKVTAIKGIDVFIKAAAKFKDVAFVVMGEGEELKKMKQMARRIKNVVFTGYFGEKDRLLTTQLYRRADIVAIPSTMSEGVPLSSLEAMSAGAVVVASNIGGIPTVIKNMKNGILIQPRSTSALVKAIESILSNNKLANRLRDTARKDVVSKFDWKAIAKRMTKYYTIAFERSQKNRVTRKPSFITDEEYKEEKRLVSDMQNIKEI
jgi:glycosyltransferase involved in cell wall biosynthesis